MTPTQLIDELTYSSYVSNRTFSPEVAPERWASIYGPLAAALMEMRYQAVDAPRTMGHDQRNGRHDGSTICGLERMVSQLQPNCSMDDCYRLATVHHLELDCPMCVKCFEEFA
jgi:hypothetical protein